MTWMVEGVGTVGGRIVVAWIAGTLLALASLNHVIVVTLELIFGHAPRHRHRARRHRR